MVFVFRDLICPPHNEPKKSLGTVSPVRGFSLPRHPRTNCQPKGWSSDCVQKKEVPESTNEEAPHGGERGF